MHSQAVAMGKKNKGKAQAESDDALLDAAIAESNEERAKLEAAAAEAKAQADAEAAQPGQSSGATIWGGTLNHQEVVDKLDMVPVFNIIRLPDRAMVPTEDDFGITGEPSGCWYFDHEDAQKQLERMQAENPSLQLALETTSLGTAFALSEGWQPVPDNAPLRLQASRGGLSELPEPPDPLPDVLRERFNPRTGPIPLLGVDGFRLGNGSTPLFFGIVDLVRTWTRDTGKTKEEMPSLTLVDLRLIVARMLSDEGQDWRLLTFCAARKSLEYAAELHTRDVDLGDEPPPLE